MTCTKSNVSAQKVICYQKGYANKVESDELPRFKTFLYIIMESVCITNEKYLAWTIFRLKIYESNGVQFERLFVAVLSKVNKDFQPVKPLGNIGDRKNDGFDQVKGVYYQVYAPEDIRFKDYATIKKLNEDFIGLCSYWEKICKINEFYFVINDKYLGVSPKVHAELAILRNGHAKTKFDLMLANALEDMFLELPLQKACLITGPIPDPKTIVNIKYSVLDEVINHLLANMKPYTPDRDYPKIDFEGKIKFNGLSPIVANLLNVASYNDYIIGDFLRKNSNFVRKDLQEKFNEFYKEGKGKFDLKKEADLIFFYILSKACPREEKQVQDAALVLMSHYFETCDIFEEPP